MNLINMSKKNKSNPNENILQFTIYIKLQKRPDSSKVKKNNQWFLGLQWWVELMGKGHKGYLYSNGNVLLRVIISNHGSIDSLALEMNVLLQGTRHTLPTLEPLCNFGQTQRKDTFVC